MLFLFSALCLCAPVADSWSCTLCQQLVIKVEELITTETVESEIVAACDLICQQMQAPYSTLCSSVVAQYVPIICEWIKQGIETSKVCEKLGFCDPELRKKGRLPVIPSNSACSACQQAVAFIEETLKSTTVVEEIIDLCDGLCEKQQIISDICKYIVKTYVPVVINWLEQGLESLDICTKIGFCAAPRHARVPMRASGNSVLCSMCEKSVAYIRVLHEQGKTPTEITAITKAVCNTFPAPLSTTCIQVIADYVQLIIHMIDEGSTDHEVCGKIGLCLEEKWMKKAMKKQAVPVPCTMCQTVVTLVQKLIESTTVESEIETAVAKYCQSLTSPLGTICESLVQQFIPIIIDWVEQGIEALNICVNLGLCEANLARKVRPVVKAA